MRFDDGTIPQLSSPSTFAVFSLALLLLARNRISKKG
jgi:hypothetical protein